MSSLCILPPNFESLDLWVWVFCRSWESRKGQRVGELEKDFNVEMYGGGKGHNRWGLSKEGRGGEDGRTDGDGMTSTEDV